MSNIAPIFIIGAARSGTTLLKLMISNHPNIFIPIECGFFMKLEEKYKTKDIKKCLNEFINDLYQIKRFDELGIKKEQICIEFSKYNNVNYKKSILLLYGLLIVNEKAGAIIWGNKTVGAVDIDLIYKYFPEAKIIHIIRDVRAVYNSVKKKAISQFGRSPYFLCPRVTRSWKKAIAVNSKNKNVYTIFYEKLLDNPKVELVKICDWLGVEFDEMMIKFYITNRDKGLIPAYRKDYHGNTFHSVQNKRAMAWKFELKKIEIENIEKRNCKLLKKLGYHVENKQINFYIKLLVFVENCFFLMIRIYYGSARKTLNLLQFKVLEGFEKYLLIVSAGLVVIYVINYVGVEFFSLKPQITYFIATGINYIVAFFANAKIFGKNTTAKNLKKFIFNSIIFFFLNNYLFHMFVTYFSIHYLIAITINFAIFPVIKFLSYKKFVFK